MKQKNIVATLYLKDGHAVKSMTDFTPVDANVYRLCQLYNDSGVDKIIIFDLSTSDDEHEKNVNTIRNINRNIDIKVCDWSGYKILCTFDDNVLCSDCTGYVAVNKSDKQSEAVLPSKPETELMLCLPLHKNIKNTRNTLFEEIA